MTETMTRDEQAAPPDDAVYPDEFARMLGVKQPTLKHYVQQARIGGPQAPVGFPVPDGRVLRSVPAKTAHQPTRRVWTPWWYRATAEAYKANRLPVGYQKRDEAPAGE